METAIIDRLWPNPSLDTKPYWDGLLEGRILIQQCSGCGEYRHYPRPVCPACHSLGFEWHEIQGTGTVHSWTISHHAFHPAYKKKTATTYITADLPEKVRILAPLDKGDPSQLSVGKPLELGVMLLAEGLAVPIIRFD